MTARDGRPVSIVPSTETSARTAASACVVSTPDSAYAPSPIAAIQPHDAEGDHPERDPVNAEGRVRAQAVDPRRDSAGRQAGDEGGREPAHVLRGRTGGAQ